MAVADDHPSLLKNFEILEKIKVKSENVRINLLNCSFEKVTFTGDGSWVFGGHANVASFRLWTHCCPHTAMSCLEYCVLYLVWPNHQVAPKIRLLTYNNWLHQISFYIFLSERLFLRVHLKQGYYKGLQTDCRLTWIKYLSSVYDDLLLLFYLFDGKQVTFFNLLKTR